MNQVDCRKNPQHPLQAVPAWATPVPEKPTAVRRVGVLGTGLVALAAVAYGGYRVGEKQPVRTDRSDRVENRLVETSAQKLQERDNRIVSDEDYGEETGIIRYIAGETRKERDDRIEREAIEEAIRKHEQKVRDAGLEVRRPLSRPQPRLNQQPQAPQIQGQPTQRDSRRAQLELVPEFDGER